MKFTPFVLVAIATASFGMTTSVLITTNIEPAVADRAGHRPEFNTGIIEDVAHLYATPGDETIGQLAAGSEVHILDEVHAAGKYYYYVSYGTLRGWVYADLVLLN